MTQIAGHLQTTKPNSRIGRPPIPHEHGAWVILYAPLLIGCAVAGKFAPWAWLLLTLGVTGAFLAREAAGLLLRKRGKTGTNFWLIVYLSVMSAGILPLLFSGAGVLLAGIGVMVGALFGLHSLLLLRGRLDRSQWGEILGVGALTLTAPAAYAITRQRLDVTALLVWMGCLLYFSGGIFYVKMWLRAVKRKADWNETARRQCRFDCLTYHLILSALLAGTAVKMGVVAGGLLIAAYLPALCRAFYGGVNLSSRLPNLKRVGKQELLLSVWFTACFLLVIRDFCGLHR